MPAIEAKSIPQFDTQDIATLNTARILKNIFPVYSDLIRWKEQLYERYHIFIESLIRFMASKVIEVGKDNYINFIVNEVKVALHALSSGEKQLFILLGEC